LKLLYCSARLEIVTEVMLKIQVCLFEPYFCCHCSYKLHLWNVVE